MLALYHVDVLFVNGFLRKMKKLLDKIHCKFQGGDYEKNNPLSGEFLLGYHRQRHVLIIQCEKNKKNDPTMETSKTTTSTQGD